MMEYLEPAKPLPLSSFTSIASIAFTSVFLVPSHVRESYLYYLLRHPPESTLHLRRAPPEPVKRTKKTPKSSKPPPKKAAKKKKKASADGEDEDEIERMLPAPL